MALKTAFLGIFWYFLQKLNLYVMGNVVIELFWRQEKVLVAIVESAKFTGNHRFYSIVQGLTINDDKELKVTT